MRLRTACLILSLLFAGAGQQALAQRAGLWEAHTAIDGTPVGAPVRACRVAGAQLVALRAWPAKCVAEPLRRTASGIVAQAECGGSNTGLSVKVRYELTGDLDRVFRVVNTTRIDGVQEMPATAVTLRYLGSCASDDQMPPVSEASIQPTPQRASWLVTMFSIVAQTALMFVPIGLVALVMRRRLKSRRDRTTVVNIVTDETGTTSISVLATFIGVSGLPWWYAVALNNAAPLFVIEPDGIRFRVIRQRHRSFEEIACVDVRQAPGTVNLYFTFHGSMFTFAANVGTVQLAAHVIGSLPPGVPLSSRAQAVRAAP